MGQNIVESPDLDICRVVRSVRPAVDPRRRYMVDVFQDKGSTRTIMFSALVGALLIFIQFSRGVEGFINILNKLIVKLEKKQAEIGRAHV